MTKLLQWITIVRHVATIRKSTRAPTSNVFSYFLQLQTKCSMSIAHERLTTICIDLELFMQFSWFFHRQPLLSLPLPQICTWNKTNSLMSSLWEEKNIKKYGDIGSVRACIQLSAGFHSIYKIALAICGNSLVCTRSVRVSYYDGCIICWCHWLSYCKCLLQQHIDWWNPASLSMSSSLQLAVIAAQTV